MDRGLDAVSRRAAGHRPVQIGSAVAPGRCLNCARITFLSNLPTLVLGIASTNSTSSGSHHLANRGSRIRQDLVFGDTILKLGLRNDHGERPLLPLGMLHRDHRGFQNLRMAHDGVLQIDARDPFAAALDHVLGAIDQLHVAFRIDGGHVAGAEPAIHESRSRARIVVVTAGDPRPAHLHFANGLRRPTEPRGPDRPPRGDRRRPPAAPAWRAHAKHSSSERCSKSHFNTETVPTGVVSVMPQSCRSSMPCSFSYVSMSWRGSAEPAPMPRRMLDTSNFSSCRTVSRPDPDRRHAACNGDALVLNQLREVARLRMLARQHDLRARHDRGERRAPAVGMKHRHHLQHHIALARARRCPPSQTTGCAETARDGCIPRLLDFRWCRRCSTYRRRSSHRAAAKDTARRERRPATARSRSPSPPMTTNCRTHGMRSRIFSRIGTSDWSTKMTRSSAWLMMYARSSGESRRLSVCSTAP